MKVVGKKTITKNFTKPYFDWEVRQAIKERRRAYKTYHSTGIEQHWREFVRLRREFHLLLRKKKTECHQRIMSKLKTLFDAPMKKAFWSMFQRISRRSTRVRLTALADVAGRVTINPQKVQEDAAKYFEELCTLQVRSDRFDNRYQAEVEERVRRLAYSSIDEVDTELDVD